MTDDRLVVHNKDSDTISVIDPNTGEVDAVVETDRTNNASVPDWTEVDRLETELHPDGIACVERRAGAFALYRQRRVIPDAYTSALEASVWNRS